jgi:hypothetical protein
MKLVATLLLAAGTLALAQQAPSTLPKVKFTDTRLDNGLRVIVAEDHFAPLYAICVSYKVGSRDEHQGRTGFAHLFEHMMFKGSENVGTGELDFLIFTNGGNSNGTTNTDRTSYYEVLPKNQLDLGLYLEADRMRGLVITLDNLENQRQAVKEERRQSVDNQAYGQTSEKLEELIYDNFAYHHSVIGSMDDLDAASVDDVKQFFKIYYAPNNAVLALVGDLDTKETLAKVKKYFGSIPRQDPPKPVDLTEPPKSGERRATVEDKLARLTRQDSADRLPPAEAAVSAGAAAEAGPTTRASIRNWCWIRRSRFRCRAPPTAVPARGSSTSRPRSVQAKPPKKWRASFPKRSPKCKPSRSLKRSYSVFGSVSGAARNCGSRPSAAPRRWPTTRRSMTIPTASTPNWTISSRLRQPISNERPACWPRTAWSW